MAWQRSARIGVAVVGVASAALIYATLGTREAPVAPAAPPRVDPTAVIETAGADLQQLQGARRDYRIEADRQLTYEDGTTRFLELRITVDDREGRDFVVTGREAEVGPEDTAVTMTGGVRLSASDGFVLDTDEGTFSDASGLVAAPGAARFRRGGMQGSGTGMAYDTGTDLLRIADDAAVSLIDADGARVAFTARRLAYDRTEQRLELEETVRIQRGNETFAAEQVTVELDEAGERPRLIALRERAVAELPGGAVESMHADAIDLDYSDDGRALEHVGLSGDGEIALAPEGSADAGATLRAPGIAATLGPDGSLDTLGAVEGATLVLPDLEGRTSRVVAGRMDAQGDATGLRSAYFDGGVTFAEVDDAGARRSATAMELGLQLGPGRLDGAVFAGDATFEAGDLRGSAEVAQYSPGRGELTLRSPMATVRPRLEGERLLVEGEMVDVMLAPRAIHAAGDVQTTFSGALGAGEARLPALLDEGAEVSVSAGTFEYGGEPASAVWGGGVVLWQGDTTVRATRVEIDQATGNLVAAGGAQTSFTLDGTASIGIAPVIRYDEGARRLFYGPPAAVQAAAADAPTAAAPGTGVAPAGRGATPAAPVAVSPAPAPSPARVSGAQGDLTAGAIAVRLAPARPEVLGIDATTAVQLLLDGRTATGDAMTYDAAAGRYEMTGSFTAPAVLVDGCRRTEGGSLVFVAGGDQVIVDGGAQARSRTADTPCAEAPAP